MLALPQETCLSEVEYARTVGEHVAEVGAIGCPVVVDGVVYSIAIAGPASRIVPASDDLAARIKTALADLDRNGSR